MARRKSRSRRKGELENARWERFCQLFVYGHHYTDPEDPTNPPQTKHNATESYLQAGYKQNRLTAGPAGYRLIRKHKIQARLGELKDEAARIQKAFLHQWKMLVPAAQEVLIRGVNGKDVTPAEIQCAKEIIEQAMGPTRFRFGVDKGGDSTSGLNVTIWAGRKE